MPQYNTWPKLQIIVTCLNLSSLTETCLLKMSRTRSSPVINLHHAYIIIQNHTNVLHNRWLQNVWIWFLTLSLLEAKDEVEHEISLEGEVSSAIPSLDHWLGFEDLATELHLSCQRTATRSNHSRLCQVFHISVRDETTNISWNELLQTRFSTFILTILRFYQTADRSSISWMDDCELKWLEKCQNHGLLTLSKHSWPIAFPLISISNNVESGFLTKTAILAVFLDKIHPLFRRPEIHNLSQSPADIAQTKSIRLQAFRAWTQSFAIRQPQTLSLSFVGIANEMRGKSHFDFGILTNKWNSTSHKLVLMLFSWCIITINDYRSDCNQFYTDGEWVFTDHVIFCRKFHP